VSISKGEGSRKDHKRKLGLINKTIKELAQGKQLGLALREFNRLYSLNITPSIHSFTNIINACVRCGEVQRATDFALEMRQAGLTPNEVTRTVLLKGLVNEGMLGQARIELDCMAKEGCPPNLRTYDTVLRGCVRHGDTRLALHAFGRMAQKKIEPSAASYESLMRVLGSNLRTAQGWQVHYANSILTLF
jgi:pentatricopeptide repeat protein